MTSIYSGYCCADHFSTLPIRFGRVPRANAIKHCSTTSTQPPGSLLTQKSKPTGQSPYMEQAPSPALRIPASHSAYTSRSRNAIQPPSSDSTKCRKTRTLPLVPNSHHRGYSSRDLRHHAWGVLCSRILLPLLLENDPCFEIRIYATPSRPSMFLLFSPPRLSRWVFIPTTFISHSQLQHSFTTLPWLHPAPGQHFAC